MTSPDPVHRARWFLRDYTAGLRLDDLKRLFDREAAEAYTVLARDRDEPEPAGDLKRFLHRAKILFLGISYKLSPARRALFAASLLAGFFGFAGGSRLEFDAGGAEVVVDFSGIWFLAAIGGLVFLLVVELVDKVRVRDELEVARQLQREILPGAVPSFAGWSFAHAYRTANEVGGDYYDFLPVPGGRLALVVGDASGHGIAAGLLMAIANATLKAALEVDPDPLRVTALLNRTLCRTGDRRAFMSLFYGLLDPATGRLDYLCAGQPFPLLRRATGVLEELGEGGLPLGIREPLTLLPLATTVGPGDRLLLYTDGLPEAVGSASAAAFGFERLRQLLAEPGAAAEIKERVLAAFESHLGREPVADDLTVVVIGRD